MLVVIILISLSFSIYLIVDYQNSRNKELKVNSGLFKGSVYAGIILFIICVVGFIFPSKIIPIDTIKLNLSHEQYYSNPLLVALTDPIRLFGEMNVIDGIIAILVSVFWTILLNKLLNLKIPYSKQLAFILIGVVLPFVAVPMAGYFKSLLQTQIQQVPFWRYLYLFFEYGLFPELLKILIITPLLLRNKKTEAIEMAYLACLIGLGYAFSETIYRDKGETGLLVPWAISLSFFHMTQSTLGVYGFIKLRNKSARGHVGNIFTYIFLAASLSALIQGLSRLYIFDALISILFFPAVIIWGIMISNAYNSSPKKASTFSSQRNESRFVIIVFAAISMAVTYFICSVTVEKFQGYENGWLGLFWIAFIFVCLLIVLSDIDVFPGYWKRVQFSFYTDEDRIRFYLYDFIVVNTTVIQNLLDRKIYLHSTPSNKLLSDFFGIEKGIIKKRIILCERNQAPDPDWYIVRLKNKMDIIDDFKKQYLAIKLHRPYASLDHDTHIKCYLKLINAETVLSNRRFHINEFYDYGRLEINGHDFDYDTFYEAEDF